MLEMASFLKYVDLYLTSKWAGFMWDTCISLNKDAYHILPLTFHCDS
jgi:hypothetical protein